MWWALLIALSPPCFIVLHTLIGAVLLPIYGVREWRWRAGAIEVLCKVKDDGTKYGTSRIWFKPGAQTWGLFVFCAQEWNYEGKSLQVHERVHILQTYLFGAFYLLTYALSFGVLFAIVKLKLDWWERNITRHNGRDVPDDDVWHAYRMIPWEIWAYSKQRRFERGEFQDAWGSFNA